MRTYEFSLTRLAQAVADMRYSREAVERRAREEIDNLGLADPTALVMHCFRMPGRRDYEFICTPDEQGTGFLVDTVSYEESGPLQSGPYKGKKVLIPTRDSDT